MESSQQFQRAAPPWSPVRAIGQVRPLPVPAQPAAPQDTKTPHSEHELMSVGGATLHRVEPAKEPGFEPMLAELETAEAALRSAAATVARARDAIRAAIDQSATLEATAQTLIECERDLGEARTAGERDRLRASALESELTRRNDVFHNLRSKLRDLLGSVESDGGSLPLL